MFVTVINWLIKLVSSILNVLFTLLPPSPFKVIDNSPISEYLQYINYFCPVDEVVAIGEVWLTAIGIYYLVQVVLRWVKGIA